MPRRGDKPREAWPGLYRPRQQPVNARRGFTGLVSKVQGDVFMKNSKYPTSTFNPAYPADVVCEFTIAGRSCQIVRTPSPEYAEKAAIPKHSGEERTSVIANFTINGETYTVIQNNSNDASERDDLATLLSARELQIAALVAMGYPNKLVAYKLHISEWTVASYLRRIFSKLGVETRAAMAFRCAQLIWKFEGTSSCPEPKQRKSLV